MFGFIHTTRDCKQYSAIAVLHTLQFAVTHALEFSVFTSRILATDLQQSHCHLKSHMKFSFHSLIPFLPLLCNCQRSSVPLFPSSYSGRLASRSWTLLLKRTFLYNHFARTTQKTSVLLLGKRGYSIVACIFIAAECVYRVVAYR
jgi:hypothetical protein